ncbi:M28 family peptidase [Halomicronema hongdechloris]|uniref:M28 family peptidase n=1 Tax=Halomicronema hongdechloris TaxID=1209493 RepID=UPI001CECD88F|nr:M28 family peptidase [Halomicronema hongdechloris]
MAHLEQVIRDRNPFLASAGHFYGQQYIRETLGALAPLRMHPFEAYGRQFCNWSIDLPGQYPERGLLIVGAHFDTVPGSPGADDNGTGVAVLLELARYFARYPPQSPLRLVAFDLEEMGLQGSHAYAAQLKQQGTPLRLMISLEMLGYCDRTSGSQRYPPGLQYFYPNRGDFIGLIGNLSTLPTLMHLHRHLQRAGVPCEWLPVWGRGQGIPDTRRSDHAAFWDQGYSAILVTDTANLRNPHYHQPSDRLDTLDLEFLTRVCRGLMAGLAEL